jgi:creatinine amidohydrolase
MTEFFVFEHLTWPEVHALPRHTPLVISLGEGYDPTRLASALGEPPRAGMLPPLPYGWRGSGLETPDRILGALVGNLLDSLRADGFTRVYALTPPEVDLGLGASRIALANGEDTGLLPQRLPPASALEKVILLPFGHTEQHGYHLPLSVDTICIAAVCQETAALLPDKAYPLPVFPYGVSTHRSSFAGTLNCGGRAFEDFVLAGLDCLAQRGFTRFYLLSGHGGNCSFLVNVAKYAGERHPHAFCATSWLYLSSGEAVDSVQRYRRSGRGGMGHAGELETSFILHLRPELAHMERVVDETNFISTPNYYMDWVEGGALVANPPWYDDTQSGAYGAGSLATAENGARWLAAAAQEKAGHVREIHEQYARRLAMRQERARQGITMPKYPNP